MLAVDGGGSKTDVVAVTLNGELVGSARGASSNPQLVGVELAVNVIDELVDQVLADVGDRTLVHAGIYLSGLDLPVELTAFSAAIVGKRWAAVATGAPALVENDLFALLRVGTKQPDAIAVICGTGINAIGVRADGATVRFAALGMISGDWGGGYFLGEQAVWHAARSEDGRGPKSVLQQLVPATFGLSDVASVTEGFHFGRLGDADMTNLAPVLFTAADTGDAVAICVVERQAEEIVALIATTLRRLDLLETDVPVILGGGVLAAQHPKLIGDISTGLQERAAHAQIRVVQKRPILGAALLCLEAVGASDEALARITPTLS